MDCQSLVRVDKEWNCRPCELSKGRQKIAYDKKNHTLLCVVGKDDKSIRRFKISSDTISDIDIVHDDDDLVKTVGNYSGNIYITKQYVKGKLQEHYICNDDVDTEIKCMYANFLVVEDIVITYNRRKIFIITPYCVFETRIKDFFDIIHPLADGNLLFLKKEGKDYTGHIRKSWQHGFEIIRNDITLNFIDINSDHLGNVVLLKNAPKNRAMIEIYNCQLQLLAAYYIDSIVQKSCFTLNPDQKQFIITGIKADWRKLTSNTEIHLYDIPYTTWSHTHHKFFSKYHAQIHTLLTLALIVPCLNVIPIELFGVIFSSFIY